MTYYININTGEILTKKEALAAWIEATGLDNPDADIPFSEMFAKI